MGVLKRRDPQDDALMRATSRRPVEVGTGHFPDGHVQPCGQLAALVDARVRFDPGGNQQGRGRNSCPERVEHGVAAGHQLALGTGTGTGCRDPRRFCPCAAAGRPAAAPGDPGAVRRAAWARDPRAHAAAGPRTRPAPPCEQTLTWRRVHRRPRPSAHPCRPQCHPQRRSLRRHLCERRTSRPCRPSGQPPARPVRGVLD